MKQRISGHRGIGRQKLAAREEGVDEEDWRNHQRRGRRQGQRQGEANALIHRLAA